MCALVVLLLENESAPHNPSPEALAIYTQLLCYLFCTAAHCLRVSQAYEEICALCSLLPSQNSVKSA